MVLLMKLRYFGSSFRDRGATNSVSINSVMPLVVWPDVELAQPETVAEVTTVAEATKQVGEIVELETVSRTAVFSDGYQDLAGADAKRQKTMGSGRHSGQTDVKNMKLVKRVVIETYECGFQAVGVSSTTKTMPVVRVMKKYKIMASILEGETVYWALDPDGRYLHGSRSKIRQFDGDRTKACEAVVQRIHQHTEGKRMVSIKVTDPADVSA